MNETNLRVSVLPENSVSNRHFPVRDDDRWKGAVENA
jgi:hypothetical protein